MPGRAIPGPIEGGDGITVEPSGRIGLTPADPFEPDAVTSAALLFWGEPEGIASAGGLVSSWADVRDNGAAYTAAGAEQPPLSADGGVGPFGVGQRLSSVIALPSDAEVTIFLVSRQLSTANGMLWNMSDNGAANRSTMILNDAGFRVDRYAGLGSAFFVNASDTSMQRHVFDANSRGAWRDGVWRADSNLAAAAVRSPTLARLGNYIGADAGAQEVFYALLVYSGFLSDADTDSVEQYLQARFETAALPVLWPPASVAPVGDPRIVLPQTIDVAQGQDLELWRQGVHYRTGLTPQVITSPSLPLVQDPPDRWRAESPPIGSYPITLDESGYVGSSVVRVSPDVGSGTTVPILCFGDSITREGTWVRRLARLMPRLQMVGTLTVDGIAQQGISGATWTTFDSAGSPFWNGGAALDFPGYFAGLAAVPEIMVAELGTNDWNTNDAGIEAAITASFARVEAIWAAARAAEPTIRLVLLTPFPGNGDAAAWVGGEAARLQFLRCMNRATQRMLTQFQGREASDGIYVCWTIGALDALRDYRGAAGSDTLHPNYVTGQRRVARAIHGTVNRMLQP